MREILFRGKRVSDGKWLQGMYDNDEYGADFDCITPPKKSDDHISADWSVIPETVGQFTGLTDKNGVRIFEGDIVRYTNHVEEIYHEEIGVCEFEQSESNFALHRTTFNPENYPVPTTMHTIYLISNVEYEASYEVIGNIHDNPELR